MSEDLLVTQPELLRAFRRGKKEAMRAVFQAYEPLVRTIARRGFGDFRGYTSACDVDDAVSGTFAAAFSTQARLRYDGLSPYAGYLGGIARNTIRSMGRKNNRELALSGNQQLDNLCDQGSTPEDLSMQAEEPLLAQRFKEYLKDPLLVTICERHLGQGQSEATVAGELGITRHQVRKALKKLRKRIALFLKAEGLEP